MGYLSHKMDKYDKYNPDEETIEAWLKGFEIRLLYNNIAGAERKRNWCRSLVGEAGNSIIEKLPTLLTGQRSKRNSAQFWAKAILRREPSKSSAVTSRKVKAWGKWPLRSWPKLN